MQKHSPTPTEINLNRASQELNVTFDDGAQFKYTCEYLRVFSPAAEVKVAREKGEVIKVSENINIERISPVGSYAIQLAFNDNHDTGVYSWKTLYELGKKQQQNWDGYLEQKNAKHKVQTYGERKVEVLYFAALAQIIDELHETLVLSDDTRTVEDLLVLLSSRGDLWAQQLEHEKIRVTINKQFVEKGHMLQEGDEIALIP